MILPKGFLPSRLVTRTKESIIGKSIGVMKTPMRNESNDEKRIRASPDVLADALFTDFEH